MNFTEHQVEQYEMFAEIIKDFDYVNDNMETKFLIFLLNIESLLPNSNIFNYTLKTDNYKEEKFQLQVERENNYALIEQLTNDMEEIGNRIKNSYSIIENVNHQLSKIDNDIDESEWKVDIGGHEELTFNSIKQKLIIEKKLNYGNI